MPTSNAVRRFLETRDVKFSSVSSPWNSQGRWQGGVNAIPHAAMARPILLKDGQGMVMAVVPITGRLDLAALNCHLQRQLKLAEKSEFPAVFAQCTSFILPALGPIADLETVIDNTLLKQETIYISSGQHDELICLSGEDYRRLNPDARYGHSLSRQPDKTASTPDSSVEPVSDRQETSNVAVTPRADIRERIQRTTQLPGMPSLAHKIIQLNANPYAHAEDLAKLVEKDPSLSAQIVRYAQSPFFGYQGAVASVRQAVSRVLGYDLVMNIALGIAVARPFKITHGGPLGLDAFWRHAIYSAALTQALSKLMPHESLLQTGTAYLTGLLHNFGILILGHLFPKEFDLLHAAVRQEPETPLVVLEQRLLNTTHMEMGAWLMTEWNMPQEVIVVQEEHHNPDYNGPHVNYVRLAMLVNYLLKEYDLGDAETSVVPANLLEALGLRTDEVNKVLEKVMGSAKDLDVLARKLAA